jgi:hypothetical protein
MKTVIFYFFLAFFLTNANGQSNKEQSAVIQNNQTNSIPVTYRLYPTDNMWTFIKLNTRNGQMWQVQYSMNDNRFESSLSLVKLVEKNEEFDNRFTLYKTQNTWTFILLDQIDGRTWQVQWSTEYDKRGVIPIQ